MVSDKSIMSMYHPPRCLVLLGLILRLPKPVISQQHADLHELIKMSSWSPLYNLCCTSSPLFSSVNQQQIYQSPLAQSSSLARLLIFKWVMSTLATFNKLRSHMQIFILPWIHAINIFNISASGSLNQIRNTGTLVCQIRRPFPLAACNRTSAQVTLSTFPSSQRGHIRVRPEEWPVSPWEIEERQHVGHHKAHCLLFAAFRVPVYVWVRNV